jgi:hypothetical protein
MESANNFKTFQDCVFCLSIKANCLATSLKSQKADSWLKEYLINQQITRSAHFLSKLQINSPQPSLGWVGFQSLLCAGS